MSLQSHRRHLQQLLTQTITVLCRNSLPFAAQFSVEGLLGITLDQDEVFLVNIRETVNKYAPDLARHPSEESLHSPGPDRLAQSNAQRASPEIFSTKLAKIQQDLTFHSELSVTSPPPQARSVPPQPTVIKPRADHVTPRRVRRDSEDPEVINNIQRILQNAKMEMEDKTPQFQKPPPMIAHHQMPVFPENEHALNFSMNKPDMTQTPEAKPEVKDDQDVSVTVAPELMTIKLERDEEDECNAAADLFKWHEIIRDVLDATGMTEPTEENYEEAMSRGVEAVMATCQLSDIGRLQCPMCLDILRSQYHLRRHLRTHVGSVLPYPITTHDLNDSCSPKGDNGTPEPPPDDVGLTDDEWVPQGKPGRRLLNKRDPRFTCKVCGLRSKCRSDMQKHMYTHTGEKPHRCPDCGKGFRQTGALNVHRKCHMGTQPTDRPFVCDTCGKGFKQSSHLNVHKLIHTGERPHTCPVCAKGFNVSSNLRKHMLYHTGELPYTCSYCPSGFRHLSSLKTHVFKTHRFITSSQLRKHMQAHTGELAYRCAHCLQGFMYLSALRSHVFEAHSILPNPGSRATSNGSVDTEGTPRPASQPNLSHDEASVKDIRSSNTPSPRAFSEPHHDEEEQIKEEHDVTEPEAKKVKEEQPEACPSPRANSTSSSSPSPGRLTLDVDMEADTGAAEDRVLKDTAITD